MASLHFGSEICSWCILRIQKPCRISVQVFVEIHNVFGQCVSSVNVNFRPQKKSLTLHDKEARKENAMDQTCTNEFADLLEYRVINLFRLRIQAADTDNQE